jgi:hypothetical protein
MVAARRSSVSGRALAARHFRKAVARRQDALMLVASVVAWPREADGAAGRPRSGLEAATEAAQTRQSAPRAHEIVASTIDA